MAELELTPEQRMVVDDRGGSLLVSAAAGSGKTKVLVDRLFRYVREDHANVDDFLIITYTKAAAAELRGKIATELSRRIAEAPEDTHLRGQLLRVYQADIKTVDAFCAGLLRENTHLLAREEDRRSLSPDFRTLDEEEAKLLRGRVLERTLDGFYGDIGEAGTLLADTLGHGRDDQKLEKLVLELYGKIQSHAWPLAWLRENRDRWAAMTAEGDFDATPYADILKEKIRRRAALWARRLRDRGERMRGHEQLETKHLPAFLNVAEQLERLAEREGWDSLAAGLAGLIFPKRGAVRNGGPEKERGDACWEACKKDLEKLREGMDVSAREAMEDLAAMAPAMVALLDLVARFAEDYRQEKLRRNAADFSDQEHLALTILLDGEGQPTELARQVASRYREILVDEYQDTNEVQDRIFQAVSREGKNLFTVGDVKQSIYRFRLADPGIFLRKYETYRPAGEAEDGEPRKILLSRNFRSREEVLSATNFIFQNILSKRMGGMDYGEGEKLYYGAAEQYPPREDCAVEYHLLPQGGEEKPRDIETRFVARRVRELLASRFPVTKDKSLCPCQPKDIVILLRNPGTRGAAFAAALEAENIPTALSESEDFFSTVEVSTVLSLLELIDNPRQDVALIAALRSPLYGFTPSRLAEIRSRDKEGDYLDALRADGGADCEAFLAELEDFRLRARDLSVGQLLWHIYHRRNALGVFGAMEGGERRRENLISLTEQARRWESGGSGGGVYDFVSRTRRLLESGRSPRVSVGEGNGGVRIMSIHKSKGLEFPIVILAGLSGEFSQKDYQLAVLAHPDLGLGPDRVDLMRRIRYPTLAKAALKEKLTRENREEEQRLLYVAMTRAKEKLILVDARGGKVEGLLQKLAAKASCPVEPEAIAESKCYGDWILLPLLCRMESAPLRALAGEAPELTESEGAFPWEVRVHWEEDLTDPVPLPDWREVPETPGEERPFD
ncbi:MAG: UvrD-helicase domain-containing protein, partial [Dysosmobacter sp.]|nr:UvrD-helicase domain-containing protein [Dysosmobacter sp.]